MSSRRAPPATLRPTHCTCGGCGQTCPANHSRASAHFPLTSNEERRVQARKYTHPRSAIRHCASTVCKKSAHSSCGECVKREEPQLFAFWQPLCSRINDR